MQFHHRTKTTYIYGNILETEFEISYRRGRKYTEMFNKSEGNTKIAETSWLKPWNASETKEEKERRSEEISINVYPFERKIGEIKGREVGDVSSKNFQVVGWFF